MERLQASLWREKLTEKEQAVSPAFHGVAISSCRNGTRSILGNLRPNERRRVQAVEIRRKSASIGDFREEGKKEGKAREMNRKEGRSKLT